MHLGHTNRLKRAWPPSNSVENATWLSAQSPNLMTVLHTIVGQTGTWVRTRKNDLFANEVNFCNFGRGGGRVNPSRMAPPETWRGALDGALLFLSPGSDRMVRG